MWPWKAQASSGDPSIPFWKTSFSCCWPMLMRSKPSPLRKTDVRDCEWIADLLRHGLIRPSFIPAKPIRVLRDLMRYRKSLVYQHTQEINRLHKVLETANIKLTSVVSDVWGKSGQSMIKAIIRGESDAQILAELARGTLRGKLPQLQEALEGRIQPHHRVLLQQIFAHLRFLESSMQQQLKEIEAQMEPYQEVMNLLMTHPGVQAVAAMGFISEVGIDLSRFKSAKHFASWTLVCPGNHGGRRQTQAWQNHQRQCLSACVVGRNRVGDQSYQRHLLIGAVSPLSSSDWQNQSHCSRLPHGGRELLPDDHQASSLSGAGSELLRHPRPRPSHQTDGQT